MRLGIPAKFIPYGNRQKIRTLSSHHGFGHLNFGKQVIGDMVRPNGIIGTPDGKRLYVADLGGHKTFRYRIKPDGSLTEKKLFIDTGSDGMTIDIRGNIYITTDAVKVYNLRGKLLGKIDLPEWPSNVTFGGPQKDTLFITARTSLYSIKTKTKGL